MSDTALEAMPNLQTLWDERDIHRALARFARIADTKSFTQLHEVFASDVSFDYGSGQVENGLSALQELMAHHLARCGGTQHLIGSIVVDVEGDRAVSRAYVQARHQRIDEFIGQIFDSNGEYVDHWERRAVGWRVVRRDVTWAANSGDPAIIAAAGDLS